MSIDYHWLYTRVADLGEALAAFLNHLLMSIGGVGQQNLDILNEITVSELQAIVARVEDLAKWQRRINTLLEEIKIEYSVHDVLAKCPALVEGNYELAELIRAKYGEEAMWLFSTFGNIQIFVQTYNHSGVAESMLRVIEKGFQCLQLPSYQFNFLVRKAYEHNEDPRPCFAFLKWVQHFKHQIMDLLIERRRSYFRSREDFDGYWGRICDDEVKFTKDIVIPLLHCLAMEHIYYTHSGDEYGRDVVWSYKGPFGQDRFCAAQIKAIQVSGAAGSSIDKIISQIDDAFRMPLELPDGKYFVSEFYVITSKRYTRNAISKILEKIDSRVERNNIHFIDGQRVKELVLQFLRPLQRRERSTNAMETANNGFHADADKAPRR
jgi:hypothetical protein